MIADHALQAAQIFFPDPWPKEKHAKNRLFQSSFIEQLKRIVKPKASISIATDDTAYAKQIISSMIPTFSSSFDKPYYVHEWAGYGTSYFETLWREKGKEIYYFNFIKEENVKIHLLYARGDSDLVFSKPDVSEGKKILWKFDFGFFEKGVLGEVIL